jgi:hypothetical protein
LFAFSTDYAVLVVAQLLSGVSVAAVTVLTVLVITDLTTGTGRFNLVRGICWYRHRCCRFGDHHSEWLYLSERSAIGQGF